MSELWPDLTGDCPDDWEPIRWVAAQAIHQGKTQRATAARLGVAPSTISRWKRQWKNRYGEDFLALDRARNLSGAREVASAYRLGTVGGWGDVRAAAAASNGVTADLARQIAQRRLQEILDDPVELSLLTVADLLTLAKIADMLERRADELINVRRGYGDPIETSGRLGDEPEVPEGILDGLDAPIGDEFEVYVKMAEENVTAFLHLVTENEGDTAETG